MLTCVANPSPTQRAMTAAATLLYYDKRDGFDLAGTAGAGLILLSVKTNCKKLHT